eukprot:Lithocolla_globosa_v1_NODE_1633_length_2432_cov_179.110644.p1 type:complete len:320 gc:universal NODE_1633_length_2432_cov_179.110644:1045-86(-)
MSWGTNRSWRKTSVKKGRKKFRTSVTPTCQKKKKKKKKNMYNTALAWSLLAQRHGIKTDVDFRANFGIPAPVMAVLFMKLHTDNQHLIVAPIQPEHLLYVMHFLTIYSVVGHTTFRVCEKTFRKAVWETLDIMYLRLDEVHWPERMNTAPNPQFPNMRTLVDTTFCPVNRPKDEETQRALYSGKHKRHGLKYEVGVRVEDGAFVWYTESIPGSVVDNKIPPLGLEGMLAPGEVCGGDKAYQGLDYFIVPYRGELSHDQTKWNDDFSRVRIMVERPFARVKRYKCMSTRWRHSLAKHGKVFDVVLQIVQIDMKMNPLTAV